jgi:ribosomal protein S17E
MATKFEGVMSALGSVFSSLKRIVTELVSLFINFLKMDFSAMKENIKTIKELGSNMVGNAKASYEAALAEDELNDAIACNNDITQVNKARIEELR